MRDLYADLRVPPTANRQAIHASFRTLARHFHPDFGGDSERMQAINDAWGILSRPDRRAAYDEQRATERIARQVAAAAKLQQATPLANQSEAPGQGVAPDRGVVPRPRDPNTLDYGRYEGWTIEALANHDPDYLEWLRRSPSGRGWRTRIDAALAARSTRTPVPQATARRRGLFGR